MIDTKASIHMLLSPSSGVDRLSQPGDTVQMREECNEWVLILQSNPGASAGGGQTRTRGGKHIPFIPKS